MAQVVDTDETAAWLHGVDVLPPSAMHMPPPVRATTPLRTALDLGRGLRRFAALAALDGFLRIGVPADPTPRLREGARMARTRSGLWVPESARPRAAS